MTARARPPSPARLERASAIAYDVVIPTVGRPSLPALLRGLAAGDGPLPGRILLVAESTGGTRLAVPEDLPREVARRVTVLPGRSGGPAAARNVGWRASGADWVVFLDDDVIPAPGWRRLLAEDLVNLDAGVAGSQGRIEVPHSADRAPTDWERNVAGLERARWATADMAYRRTALAAVGGFDERFRRAYREDADLALRIQRSGWQLVRGRRIVRHPVRPAGRWISLRLQAGNADDVLMWALHGAGWREAAEAPRGRAGRHLATAAAGFAAGALLLGGRRRGAALATVAWLAGTGELAWARISPGPRAVDEILTMLLTSTALPFAAAFYRAAGVVRLRRVLSQREPAPTSPAADRPAAVLLDRDGTLVVDEPYNGNPDRVVAMPGAREAVAKLRDAGIAIGVVSNQSGVGRGLLTWDQVEAVNRRVEDLLGPLGPWFVCPHSPDDGCVCRKPAPGLIVRAAAALGVDPARCAVIGDIGADVEAARAAGARAVLVPTGRTRPDEVEAAEEVAADLPAAVDLVLGAAP
jgi:histidinol-phosphate phosphatase family protein